MLPAWIRSRQVFLGIFIATALMMGFGYWLQYAEGLEPCPLCAGAVWAAQVGRVVFGAADLKAGAMGSLYNVAVDQRLNHTTEVVAGVRGDEAAELLTAFFASRR